MLNRLKEFWSAVTVPIDINECKTLRQTQRWFDEAGVREAKSAKSREELREVLLDTLADPSMAGTAVISVIRHYLQAQDAQAGAPVASSSDLERRLYSEGLSQDEYESAVKAYRQRGRSSRRKKK